MENLNTEQIRYAFLESSYRAFFGVQPEPDALHQFLHEQRCRGQQKS